MVEVNFSDIETEADLESFLRERIPNKQVFIDMPEHEFDVIQLMIKEQFGIEGLGILHAHLTQYT